VVALSATVTDYDPEGDGRENPSEVPLATDGDPTTAWKTEGYDNPALVNLKPGVGLLLTLQDAGARATKLSVSSPLPGPTFQVLGPPGPDGQRSVVAEDRFTGDGQEVDLRDVGPAGNYVLWITGDLVKDGERHRAAVGEVALRGVAKN
jgi:hypothetical protein